MSLEAFRIQSDGALKSGDRIFSLSLLHKQCTEPQSTDSGLRINLDQLLIFCHRRFGFARRFQSCAKKESRLRVVRVQYRCRAQILHRTRIILDRVENSPEIEVRVETLWVERDRLREDFVGLAVCVAAGSEYHAEQDVC